MRRLHFSFFIFLFLAIHCLHSEEGLGFLDAGRMAVEASSELRNEYGARALREGAWIWGIRAYLPKLSISVSEDDRVSEIGPDSFMKNYSVHMEQLLWDGGRLSLSRKLEKAELDFSGDRLKQMSLDIAETAVSSYRDILRRRMVLEIREKALVSLNEQRQIMIREAELGLVRQLDLLEADITVALTELDIFSLHAELEEAEWRLAEKIGLPGLPLLSESIDISRSPGLPDAEKAGALAEIRNPELAAIRFSLARRQAELKAASRSWVPSLRLTGSFGLSGRQYPLSRYSWSVGLNIDFASPWLSGNFGSSVGMDPPYERNARLSQSVSPAPDPGASFSVKSAELALGYERSRYEIMRKEVFAILDRGIKKCSLLDRKRILHMETLALEGEKFRLAELKMSLGEITRIELMEARIDQAKQEAALVEAAAALLQAERELEKFLDLAPGELSLLIERGLL